MSLYLDRYYVEVIGDDDISRAHEFDLGIQDEYGVSSLRSGRSGLSRDDTQR